MSETWMEWLARKYPIYERNSHKLHWGLRKRLYEEYDNEVEA